MKIINIGILAHVDAGKTTLTESLLYTSGAIAEQGNVDKGTTRTDTMILEQQRGITIQAAVTSFQWHRCKVNIVDTPGHMDFLAEVYRSLAVLDGAILVISAKDGVQAQTRILFHALRKMNIPTVIFINKIDQAGVDLQSVVQSVRDKLSADIIIKQTVSLSPEIVLEENTDIEAWDAVIENNDELLEKYLAGEPISREKLVREEQRRVQDASLFPVYYGSAKKGLGIQPLMDAVTGLFQPIGEQGSAALCGSVFKVEYTDCGQRRVYLRLYSGTLRLRDTVALAGREKLKITEMRIPSKGEIVRTDTAYPGEIVILPSDSVRLNDVLGDQTRLPRGNVKKCAVGKHPKSEKHGNTAQFSEVERSGTQENCGGIGSGCRLRLRPLPVLRRRQSQRVARIDPNAVVVDKNIAENDRFDLFSR